MFFIVSKCFFIFINGMLAGCRFYRGEFYEGAVNILLGFLFTFLLIQGLLPK